MLTGIPSRTPVILGRKWRVLRCKGDDCTERNFQGVTLNEETVLSQAQERLYKLMANVKNAETELLEQMLTEMPIDEQFMMMVQMSALLLFSSLAVSTLCGVDPMGGVDVLHFPMDHCLPGMGAALPLLLARLWFWSDDAPAFIHDCCFRKAAPLELLFRQFTLDHALIGTAMLSISLTVFFYPCFIGCVASSTDTYFSTLFGSDMSSHSFVQALTLTSGLIALMTGVTVSLCPEETEVITAAMRNADRYYQLTTPASCGPGVAQLRSRVFRKASWNLLETNKNACIFGAAWGCAETLYGGALWHMTGDVLATSCLFLFVHLADMYHTKTQNSES